MWNIGLEIKMDAHQKGKYISAFDLCKQLTDAKKDFVWLKEPDSQALQMALKNLDVAFKNMSSGKGFPKFKAKSGNQSFICPNNTRKIDFEKGLLTIPKIKNIPIIIDRKFKGQIKRVTISKNPTGKYFASVLVDNHQELPAKVPIGGKSMGIDLGLKEFAVLSDGTRITNPRFLEREIFHLKYLQGQTSKKKKGSNNRRKANRKIALCHERITNMRKDFLHKLSSALVRENQTICVEDLAVKNMVKNHKLARAISQVGWSEFVRQLTYKAAWYGKNLIRINRFEPSSKTCNNCGWKYQDLDLSEREWTCEGCGQTIDRDLNAARNILVAGLNIGGGVHRRKPVELPVLAGSTMKQESIQVPLCI